MPTGAQGGGGGLHILAVGVELALTADNVEGRADQLAGAFYNIKPLRVPRPARLPNPQPKPGKRPPLIDLPVEDMLDRRGACFAADTPIRTPGGWAKVQDLKAGDRVLARSEVDAEGPVEAKEVLDAFSTTARVWHLHAGGRVIATTAEHPLWVRGRGWAAAWEVRPGDSLAGHDGRWVRVDAVVDTGEHAPVYNVRVADHQTYFVGCDEWGFSVWAHNACIILYRYNTGKTVRQMDHWGIGIKSEAESIGSDLKNTTDNQPDDDDATLTDWMNWARRERPTAKVRVFPGSEPNPNLPLRGDATLKVSEQVAAAAIAAARAMRTETLADPWRWSLNGQSCFEYVAKILRQARPDLGLPPTPTDDGSRERLLTALGNLLGRHDE